MRKLSFKNFGKTEFLVNCIIFLFCFAVVFGPAFSTMNSYDFVDNPVPDIISYMGLANFDFDQSSIRRYRVIIPFLAATVNFLFEPIFSIIKPDHFSGTDFSMCMSFLIVNCCVFSIFGVYLYKLCLLFSSSASASVIGVLAILTCRWTGDLAGTPLVDSLYMLILTLVIYGVASKKPIFIIIAIFFGPWAKESFIFVAPLIFFFAPIKKVNQIGLFILSGILVFSFRYYVDVSHGFHLSESIEDDVAHIFRFSESLKRLFSFHGLYEIFSITGIWSLLFFLLIRKNIRKCISKKSPLYLYVYIIIVLIHALISKELARMFYLASPVLAIWLAMLTQEFYQFLKEEKIISQKISL